MKKYAIYNGILEGNSIEIKLAEYASDLPDKDFDIDIFNK